MLESVMDPEQAYHRCCQRYPTIDLPLEEYVARAGQSGGDFSLIHHEDLFLAIACSRGNRIAWEYFAEDYLPLLRRFSARACARLQESEDLAQELAASLMEDRRKLDGYDGRGSLSSWLRVTVARAAIDRFRRGKKEVALEDLENQGREPAQPDDRGDDTRERLDSRWGPVLAQVLKQEIERLTDRERLLLGLYYVEGVPLKLIGSRLGFHEATASRLLDAIRKKIRKGVEKELRRRHNLKPGEIQPLWRWVAESGEAWLSLKKT